MDWRGNLIPDLDATIEPDALSPGVRQPDQDTNQNQTLNDDYDSDHDDRHPNSDDYRIDDNDLSLDNISQFGVISAKTPSFSVANKLGE